MTGSTTRRSQARRFGGKASRTALAGVALGAGLTLMTPAWAKAQGQPASALKPAEAQNAPDIASDAEEMISFSQFADPISVSALIDFVADQLQVIIMQTDAATLTNAKVEFSAPIDIPKADLLSLLDTVLTPKNFALIKSPEGFYMVMPAGNAPVDFGEDAFSPTRIIRTPMIVPSSLKAVIDTAASKSNAKIVYLDELGLILSTAPPRTNRAISAIVDKITKELKSQELHRIELTHIAASEAKARVLELTGQAAQATTTVGAGGAPGAAALARVGTLGNLKNRLLIDRPTNALILRGTADEAKMVEQYVRIVDTPSQLVVKRYYAGPTAEEICRVGERKGLGSIMQGTGATGAIPGRTGNQTGFGSGFVLSGANDETFTYYGTADQQDQVQTLVDQFAELSREETLVVEFYKLRNLAAEDTADLLTSLMEVDNSQQTASSPFLPGSQDSRNQQRGITRVGVSPFNPPPPADTSDASNPDAGADAESTITPTEDVSIIADVPNNQLIIRAPRRQQREFARIIDRLDQRRPQVFLDVKIVSLNSSKSFLLTVDTSLTSPNSDVPVFTNFGLVPFGSQIPIPNSAQGITAAVFNSSFTNIVINALSTRADAQQTSMPKILVNDNEEAELSSTQEVSFASTSQVAGAPSVTSTGGNVSAGTTLTIRPTISDNGSLRLEYTIELSSFGVQPNPNLPPNKLTNNFTSIVTVPANSTIVVGGLVTSQKSHTVAKVPILGDIPLIGALFQSQSDSTTDQTIYVFITPHILRDDTFQDLRLLTRGPLEDADMERATPTLEPAVIPIFEKAASAKGAL